jgi:hypothetical protein
MNSGYTACDACERVRQTAPGNVHNGPACRPVAALSGALVPLSRRPDEPALQVAIMVGRSTIAAAKSGSQRGIGVARKMEASGRM